MPDITLNAEFIALSKTKAQSREICSPAHTVEAPWQKVWCYCTASKPSLTLLADVISHVESRKKGSPWGQGRSWHHFTWKDFYCRLPLSYWAFVQISLICQSLVRTDGKRNSQQSWPFNNNKPFFSKIILQGPRVLRKNPGCRHRKGIAFPSSVFKRTLGGTNMWEPKVKRFSSFLYLLLITVLELFPASYISWDFSHIHLLSIWKLPKYKDCYSFRK